MLKIYENYIASKPLNHYINEASFGHNKAAKIEDMKTLEYEDGTVIDVQKMMTRLRICYSTIHSNFRYFTDALNSLNIIWTHQVQTMATDGHRLFINPYFMETELKTDKKLLFVILHEVMHNILNHIARAKKHGHEMHKSNIAGDYEINGLLVTDGVISDSVAKSIRALLDSKYYGWSYERIYNDNPSDPGKPDQSPDQSGGDPQDGEGGEGEGQDGQSQGQDDGEPQDGPSGTSGSGQGNGKNESQAGGTGKSSAAKKAQESENESGGSFMDPDLGRKIAKESGYDESELGSDTDVESKWRDIATKAAGQIGSGKGGGAILNAVLGAYKSSVNWKSMLKKYIGQAISKDEEEKVGRKSFLYTGEYKNYDRKLENSLSKVLFMIDTSGSVSNTQLMKLLNESQAITDQKKVKEVTYAYYDYGLTATEVIKNKRQKPDVKKAKGGGGTSFAKAVNDLQKMQKRGVQLCVVFTDGDTIEEVTSKPNLAKKWVFVCIDRPSFEGPSYGKTIHINSDDIK